MENRGFLCDGETDFIPLFFGICTVTSRALRKQNSLIDSSHLSESDNVMNWCMTSRKL